MKKHLSLFSAVLLICIFVVGCSNALPQSDENVDVDLAVLSGTMLSVELQNLYNDVNKNVGKTVKIRGTYTAVYYEETGKYYHNVVTNGCCAESMEFVLKDGQEYPTEGTDIEFIGVFELYEEAGKTYCQLRTDDLTVL